MTTLVAVISHYADEATAARRAVRETWLQRWPDDMPVKFWLAGRCDAAYSDEWVLEADDSYLGMPSKVRAGCVRAMDEGYDHVWLCCHDAYVILPRLAQVEPPGDYAGEVIRTGNQWERGVYWVGGAGTWLGRPAMDVITASDPPQYFPDFWLGQLLNPAGLMPVQDGRYHYPGGHHQFKWDEPWSWEGRCAVNLGRGKGNYDPAWMRTCHEAFTRLHPQE
jgi:hypothetical protein